MNVSFTKLKPMLKNVTAKVEGSTIRFMDH